MQEQDLCHKLYSKTYFLFSVIWLQLKTKCSSVLLLNKYHVGYHYLFHGRLSRSTFPPHNITPTFLISCKGSALNLSDNTAATPTAAEDSIISFIRSQTSLIADMISSSVTVMTSVTVSRMMGQVFFPSPILSPSATVFGEPYER